MDRTDASIQSKHEIFVPEKLESGTFKIVTVKDSDVPLAIASTKVQGKGTLITVTEKLDRREHYLLKSGQGNWDISPSIGALVVSTVIAAALVNNYVFTKYLGLCVFFGTSKKKDTAVGMGFTFTIVAVLSGFFFLLLYQFVLAPLKLKFLEIVVFIGIIVAMVQASDFIL